MADLPASKYKRWHDSIVNNAKCRNLSDDVYKEIHHILPRSMGGGDSEDNLVELTGKEHFVVHWLLTKIFPSESAVHYAFWRMCNSNHRRQARITSSTYEVARIKHRDSVRNAMCGRFVSDETKKRMKESKRGFRHTDISRKRIKDGLARSSNPPSRFSGKRHTEEAKAKQREWSRNRNHTEDAKRRIGESRKGTNNWQFKGWYHTPNGVFSTGDEAAFSNGVSRPTVSNRCKNPKYTDWYMEECDK